MFGTLKRINELKKELECAQIELNRWKICYEMTSEELRKEILSHNKTKNELADLKFELMNKKDKP